MSMHPLSYSPRCSQGRAAARRWLRESSRLIWLAVLLGAFAGPAIAACDIPSGLSAVAPNGSEAVKVQARLFVIDVFELDDVAQAFRVDVHAELNWRDDRLSEARLGHSLAGCSLAHEAIWNPEPRLVNGREVTLRFPHPIAVDGDGNVRYSQRFTGELTNRLELQEFPFDTQLLQVVVAFVKGMAEVEVVAADGPLTHDHGFSVAGWVIQVNEPVVEPFELTHDLIFPQYRLTMTAERERGFYLGKVLLPAILIVVMAWGAYWLDPAVQPPRFGLSTSSVLTLIAFMLALGMWLPRVEYLTRADKFMIGAMTLVFLTLAEVVVTSVLNDSHRELALRINRTGRWLYPLVFSFIAAYTLFF
jgi:hypothetical protein